MRAFPLLSSVLAGLSALGCSTDAPTVVGNGDSRAAGREESDAAVIFVDRADDVGLRFRHWNGMTGGLLMPEVIGSGAALFDADGDGDLDAYLVQGSLLEPGKAAGDAVFPAPESRGDRLFLNRLVETGELRFEDATPASGIDAPGFGMGVAAADYDGDGRVDLYVTNLGPNQLWRNLGGAVFEDATSQAGVDDPRWSVPAVFFDYDGDRALDLFIGNYLDFNLGTHTVCNSESGSPDYCGPKSFRPEPDRLWRNVGDGRFEDATSVAGLATAFGGALGAAVGDFDADGRLDLYVANDWTPNQMWMNLGDGRFEDRSLLGGTAVNREGLAEASMGVDVADYDNDGDEDIFLTHLRGETNTLYRNDGRGTFSDATLPVRLGPPSLPLTGFGTAFVDWDNDGWLDLFAANGDIRIIETLAVAGEPYPLGQQNLLLRNVAGRTFEEVEAGPGSFFGELEVSRGAAVGDVDNDGDLDLLLSNNSGPARLLVNDIAPDGSWVGVDLMGGGSRTAVGALVTVERSDGALLTRRVATSRGYASSSDPRLVFGLGGNSDSVVEVRVRWPAGGAESFGSLAGGSYHTLAEGDGEPSA